MTECIIVVYNIGWHQFMNSFKWHIFNIVLHDLTNIVFNIKVLKNVDNEPYGYSIQ